MLLLLFVTVLRNNEVNKDDPDECMRKEGIFLMKELGEGAYGTATQACYKGDCGYVIKSGWITDNEIEITKIASKNQVGPYLHKWFKCQERNVMLLDKYPKTLNDYMRDSSAVLDKTYVKKLVDRLAKKVDEVGIRHNDLHSNNVMVGEDIDDYTLIDLELDDEIRPLMLIDYGLSRMVEASEYRENDWDRINYYIDNSPAPIYYDW
jgi:hypothetical protein